MAVCQAPEAASKLLAAGADKVVDPYEISGARIHELMERPEVVELMEHTVFGLQDLNIAEVTIPVGSWLHGVRLSELRRHMGRGVLLLGVVDLERGKELIFSTRGIDHNLDFHDVLVVIGPSQEVAHFQAMVGAATRPTAPAEAPSDQA
ncbi:MAG: TrkA C-terminal domain-containing protein [Pseudomonadota bacterium]